MPANPLQQFYFHADAVSIGGYLDAPNGPQLLPTPSSAALSSAGGIAQNETKAPTLPSGIKVASASTLVTGQPTKDGWTQRATSVIEGLDIFGVVTADSLVAQAFIQQPAGGGQRKVTFSGTNATNLKINGKPVTIDFRSDLVPPATRTVDAYNRTATFNPNVEWPALTTVAQSQNKALLATTGLPDWASHRYGWIGKDGPKDYTLCSLVDKIDGNTGGQTYGHCIELPDFGRICIAEVVVFPYAAQLTLLSTELTGKQCGRTAVCMLYTNGTAFPPN